MYNAQVSVDLRFDQHDEGDDLSAPLHVSVPANPCHLELVNPVALGKVRAKQDDYACTDSLLEGQHITDTAMYEHRCRGWRVSLLIFNEGR